MLRTYAAWTEGALEADVQANERAMMLTSAPHARGRKRSRTEGRSSKAQTDASTLDGLAVVQPVGTTVDRPQTLSLAGSRARGRPLSACSIVENSTSEKLAGVEGFEPPYGGIKTKTISYWSRVIH